MRIAWDDDKTFWGGTLQPEIDGCWRLLSDVPPQVGETVTITPITGAEGPHIEFRARVMGQTENILVAPFSDRRFQARVIPLDLDAESEAGLYRVLRPAA